MIEDTCEYCKYPISGMFIGTGTGKAHPHCYELNHQPFQATTVEQVARGCGDPIMGAEIICSVLTTVQRREIVDRFNREMMSQWNQRCEVPD